MPQQIKYRCRLCLGEVDLYMHYTVRYYQHLKRYSLINPRMDYVCKNYSAMLRDDHIYTSTERGVSNVSL